MAGIIPVAGPDLNFNFPWHDSLQPIGRDYLAVERSVVECATAGCNAIWVVCHDDMQPLIRYRLGEAAHDPGPLNAPKVKFLRMYKRTVPIYYVPVPVKERKSKDSFVWSIIRGAKTAEYISKSISKWTIPTKYFVSFPYGLYASHYTGVGQERRPIHSQKNHFFSYNGKTALDNEFLGLTLGMDDIDEAIFRIKKALTGGVFRDETSPFDENLSIPEEMSPGLKTHKYGPLSMGFAFAHLKDKLGDSNIREVPWFFDISTWEGYREYHASEYDMKRPIEFILKYREMVPLFREDL